MIKLIKYEFRKTLFAKLVLLLVTAVAEILFLAGVFAEWDNGVGFGVVGLALCAIVGIMYVGIDSLLVFHRDLNTKQSYMLFLTPRNSFQILGAKVLENGISIFVAGLFYSALAFFDFTTAVLHIGGLDEFLEILDSVLHSINIDIDWNRAFVVFAVMLASWLMTVVTGYLAIVLCATVLSGKRFSGLVSLIIFVILNWLAGTVMNHMPGGQEDIMTRFAFVIVAALVIAAIMYVITGWIMEKKLSV